MNPQEYPITPTHEQVALWGWQAPEVRDAGVTRERYIATQAARWGADQELKACCECINDLAHGADAILVDLRAARRPEPPSLKEKALEALEQIDGWAVSNMSHLSIHTDLVTGVETIRRALESLPN